MIDFLFDDGSDTDESSDEQIAANFELHRNSDGSQVEARCSTRVPVEPEGYWTRTPVALSVISQSSQHVR